jgi:hypothetical protein
VAPADDGSLVGNLTFTPAPNATGYAYIQVVLVDSTPPENGGDNVSLPQWFTIVVKRRPKNAPPRPYRA